MILSHTEHTRKRFHRTLSIRRTNFTDTRGNQYLLKKRHSKICWAYAERILPQAEHTRNKLHRWLSMRGTNFIAGWAYAEMLKSRISRLYRIRFSKISCYRPLGP